jgi:hypothetical protein
MRWYLKRMRWVMRMVEHFVEPRWVSVNHIAYHYKEEGRHEAKSRHILDWCKLRCIARSSCVTSMSTLSNGIMMLIRIKVSHKSMQEHLFFVDISLLYSDMISNTNQLSSSDSSIFLFVFFGLLLPFFLALFFFC